MATCLRRPMLSPAKQIPVQSLLCRMTTCLSWPVTTFFVFQMKVLLKQPLKTLSSKEMQNNNKKQCIKNKCLSGYIYSIGAL